MNHYLAAALGAASLTACLTAGLATTSAFAAAPGAVPAFDPAPVPASAPPPAARGAARRPAGAATALASAPDKAAAASGRSVGSLRFIGEQRLALKQEFNGTAIGGISGADYDPASGDWLLASDDRSAINPARYYTARLDYDSGAFRGIAITGVGFFRQADGSTYPGVKTYDANKSGEVPDIESVRFDPRDSSIWYSSEGDRKRGLDPFVRHARRDGTWLAALQLPDMFRVSKEEKGPRDNMAFEGLSFAPDGNSLWVSMEAPMLQDGGLPTPSSGAVSRITRLDREGRMLAQVAYPVDPIPATPGPGKAADNGISEILAVDARTLLVLERAAVQDAAGAYRNHVRVYLVDTDGASDVRGVAALAGASYRPAAKRLLLDLGTLGIRLDNLEAISFGPRLANGHDSLVIVSDDNFSARQVMQFLLFEVLP